MSGLKLTATTFFGLEYLLAGELHQLGAQNIETGNRAVYFEGDLGFLYKANYNLHTALRILRQLKSFYKIYKASQLYDAIASINWSEWFSPQHTFRIDVTGQTKFFNNTKFVALKAKDAIVDQFRSAYNQRPDIDLKQPGIRIVLHFKDQHLNVFLDSSGEPLYKRGYRTQTNIAPLNEVLAAGIVGLSGWQARRCLLDPMCGSGTILIEAAMLRMHIPAAINRQNFAFQKWPDYDVSLFEVIKNASIDKIRELPPGTKLFGYDKLPTAVEKARKNIKNANLDEFIKIKQIDFFKTKAVEPDMFLIFNPPYNERLSIDIKEFYKNIGDTLKQNYTGSEAWLLTGNLQTLKYVGLRPSKKIKLYNGKLEARLVQYLLYAGSRKRV